MTLLERWIGRFKLQWLIHAAILCTLSSLVIMVVMTFWPIALLVVLGMGAAQGLGIAGVVLFGASVLREVIENSKARASLLPRQPSAEPSAGPSASAGTTSAGPSASAGPAAGPSEPH